MDMLNMQDGDEIELEDKDNHINLIKNNFPNK